MGKSQAHRKQERVKNALGSRAPDSIHECEGLAQPRQAESLGSCPRLGEQVLLWTGVAGGPGEPAQVDPWVRESGPLGAQVGPHLHLQHQRPVLLSSGAPSLGPEGRTLSAFH